jgi:two-component system, NarL family, nitrate/nitrite response regulator NarL
MSRSVLVVDDHAGFRREARAILEADGFRIIGEAADGAVALAEAARLRPDVVFLDIGLPDGSGLDLVRQVRSIAPSAVVVLVSSRPRRDYGERVTGAGAHGFIDKATLTRGMLSALLDRLRDE